MGGPAIHLPVSRLRQRAPLVGVVSAVEEGGLVAADIHKNARQVRHLGCTAE